MLLPFLNPWLLLGLPAVGIPVLIHLLNRHRAQTIDWGAMDLLRRVMVFRSRQIRLEDILLMLLRCLVVLLVILAAARPTTKWLSTLKKADTGTVLVIDASLSMAHKPGVRSRFDEARERSREVLRSVEPGQPLTLIQAAARPRVLLRNVGYDPQRTEQILSDLQPLQEPLNLDALLADVQVLVAEIKAPQREVVIITDAQASSFGAPSPRARAAMERLAQDARPYFAPVAPGSEDNLALTRFELASGALRSGAIARFQTEVRNFGRTTLDAGSVSLLIGDQAVDQRPVGRLAPGQTEALSLYVPLQRPGTARLTVRLADDPLLQDNQRFGVVQVRSALRVLCVEGEAAERSDIAAGAFIATALSPGAGDPSEARPAVDRVRLIELNTVRLSDYDVVLLANVADLPDEKVLALHRYVEHGGGLMFFVGAGVRPDVFNRRFLANGAALLPAELVAPAADALHRVAGLPLDLAMPDHPVVRPLQALPRDLLTDGRFYQYMKVRLLPDGRTLLRLSGAQDPVLLERHLGRGKVLLFASSADGAWNNLVLNPAFPILLHQAVTYLARQPFEAPVTVPEPIVLPVPGLAAGGAVTVTEPPPPGESSGAQSVVQATARDGEVLAEVAATTRSGFYELRPGNDPGTLTVAANVDLRESDVRVLGAQDLAAAWPAAPLRVIAPGESVASALQQGRLGRELWQWLIGAALVLLVLESLLARWYARRSA